MLSEERKELLRKNRSRIAAYHIENGDYTTTNCKYDYGNGMICGASACLTDGERARIVARDRNMTYVRNLNNPSHGTYGKSCGLDMSDSDAEIMQELQNKHDGYVQRRGTTFEEFDDLVNKILEN